MGRGPTMILVGPTLVLVIALLHSAPALDLEGCDKALGMESGEIADKSLNASSSFSEESVGPQSARIRHEIEGGAWCPKEPIREDVSEWLQISLPATTAITAVETQGRFGNGQGREFATAYRIQYWRPGFAENVWRTYVNASGHEIMDGNENTYLAAKRTLDPLIIANKIRILPYSKHPRSVCMRIELHGCNYTEGLVSYSMPEGSTWSGSLALKDYTYDGRAEEGFLLDGLGALVDGKKGGDHVKPRRNHQDVEDARSSWVGWNNASHPQPVQLTFEFDGVRNFSAMYLYMNNQFNKDVQVFSSARVFFSVGGRYYNTEPITAYYAPDLTLEHARNVKVKLKNRIGRFIKVQLSYANRWMLISEISFASEIVRGFVPEEEEGFAAKMHENLPSPPPLKPFGTTEAGEEEEEEGKEKAEPGISEQGNQTYIGIIIGVLTAGLVLLAVAVFLLVLRHRRRRKPQGSPLTVSKEPLSAPEKRVTINMKDFRMNMNLTPMNNGYSRANGHIYGQVAMEEPESETTGMLPSSTSSYRKPPLSTTGSSCSSSPWKFPIVNHAYNTIGKSLLDSQSDLAHSADSGCVQGEYAVPDLSTDSTLLCHDSKFPVPSPAPSPRFYKRTNISTCPVASTQTQAVEPYETYDLCNGVQDIRKQSVGSETGNGLVCIPRSQLHLVKKLGQGDFGEVNLCVLENFQGDDGSILAKQVVAVKSLDPASSNLHRSTFCEELKMLSQLQDVNISRVLGVCSDQGTGNLAVVMQYMEHSDLWHYLQERYYSDSGTGGSGGGCDTQTITYGSLIYIATQVASGMKYLESLNCVHRDVAARNVLVGGGSSYHVKIADLAVYQVQFSTHYYRRDGGPPLPIRWMATESLILGKWSVKSDVWSFGVTLWEILTLARSLPFALLSPQELLENHVQLQKTGQAQMLPQPPHCPKELYDLMRECWRRSENDRPNFREIHLFLQRKNLGYRPDS